MNEKMNVYSKLQKVRVELQKANLKKSGLNKFSGYSYFELKDFLPAVNEMFSEIGLFSQISFSNDLAVLRIVNCDKSDEVIEFTSPMSQASLKGCHDVQNLGAVQSYLRRYLYINALEIVESDTLDAVTGNTNTYSNTQPAKELSPKEAGALVLNFGKHKGKTMKEVYKADPSWIKWASENATSENVKQAAVVMLQALQTKAPMPTKEEFEELGNDCPF